VCTMARHAGCVVAITGTVEGEAHEAFEWHRSGGADAVPEFLAERSEGADLLLHGLARHQELRTPASGRTDRSVARACRRLASSTMPERSMPMPNIDTTQVSGSIHRAASGACRSLPPAGETSKSMSG